MRKLLGAVLPMAVMGCTVGESVTIDDPGISRAHARIDLAAPPVVVDLGSTNGTWVDGRRVQQATLHDGAALALGSTNFVVRLG